MKLMRSAHPIRLSAVPAAGAMPPLGTYGMRFATLYCVDHVDDANGNDLNIPGFRCCPPTVFPR